MKRDKNQKRVTSTAEIVGPLLISRLPTSFTVIADRHRRFFSVLGAAAGTQGDWCSTTPFGLPQSPWSVVGGRIVSGDARLLGGDVLNRLSTFAVTLEARQ